MSWAEEGSTKNNIFLPVCLSEQQAGLLEWPDVCSCKHTTFILFLLFIEIQIPAFLCFPFFKGNQFSFHSLLFILREFSVLNLLWASASAIWNNAVVSSASLFHLLLACFQWQIKNPSHSHPKVLKCLYKEAHDIFKSLHSNTKIY